MTSRVRMSWRPAVVALAVVGAGLGVRALTHGAVAKYGGIALYAVLIYLLVLLVRPSIRPFLAGAVALAVCWMVEFFQLTPWPAALSARSVVSRLVLGSGFNAPDLGWYAVGVGCAAAVHLVLQGRAARDRSGRGVARRPFSR